MLTKIISLIMSLIMPVTGFLYTSASNVVDSVSEMLFGIPYTDEAVKSDFFSELDDNEVVAVDDNNGYIKDLVAVFIDDDLSFSEKLTLFAKAGGAVIGWSAVADLYVIRYLPMSYNSIVSKCESINEIDGVVFAMPVTTSKTVSDFTPNDPFDNFDMTSPKWDELNPQGSNWWLEAIQARQAWDYADYFNKINIGIVDSGFDTNHSELSGKISFPSSFHASRNYPGYHGTHVAGIIAAKHNNNTGVAGICDNSNLICIDWEPELLQFWNTSLAIFFGFSEVVKAGAKVVNFSLGTSGSKYSDVNGLLDEYFVTAALSIMMSSLLSKGYDFIAVQSAGNGDFFGDPMNANLNGHFSSLHRGNIVTVNGVTADEILDRIIIVASAETDGNGGYIQSYFTNVGHAVSIAAPGSNVYSCSVNEGYEYLSGTSMAAPVVTGVASLVWSVNPSFTGAQVRDIVCTSYSDVAKINPQEYYYDVDLVNYPMVNAKLAVEEAIRISYDTVGTVSGRIIGADASEIEFDGQRHTLYADGSYSFVASESNGDAVVFDKSGNEIGSFEITVIAGAETSAGDYEIIPGTDEIPDEGKDDINA